MSSRVLALGPVVMAALIGSARGSALRRQPMLKPLDWWEQGYKTSGGTIAMTEGVETVCIYGAFELDSGRKVMWGVFGFEEDPESVISLFVSWGKNSDVQTVVTGRIPAVRIAQSLTDGESELIQAHGFSLGDPRKVINFSTNPKDVAVFWVAFFESFGWQTQRPERLKIRDVVYSHINQDQLQGLVHTYGNAVKYLNQRGSTLRRAPMAPQPEPVYLTNFFIEMEPQNDTFVIRALIKESAFKTYSILISRHGTNVLKYLDKEIIGEDPPSRVPLEFRNGRFMYHHPLFVLWQDLPHPITLGSLDGSGESLEQLLKHFVKPKDIKNIPGFKERHGSPLRRSPMPPSQGMRDMVPFTARVIARSKTHHELVMHLGHDASDPNPVSGVFQRSLYKSFDQLQCLSDVTRQPIRDAVIKSYLKMEIDLSEDADVDGSFMFEARIIPPVEVSESPYYVYAGSPITDIQSYLSEVKKMSNWMTRYGMNIEDFDVPGPP